MINLEKFGGMVPKVKNPIKLADDKSQVSENCRFDRGGIVPLKEDFLSMSSSKILSRLAITKSGSGIGTVTSDIAGIDCGATCSHDYDKGTSLILTATPDGFSVFDGWSGGGLSGTGPGNLTLIQNTIVNAAFSPILPKLNNLIAWYKVNEGSGTELLNSAPTGPYKLPSINVVVQNTDFWTNTPGFGYWSIAPTITQVYATWTQINAFTGNKGTVMCFGKDARGAGSGIGPYLYTCYNAVGIQYWWWSAVDANIGITHEVGQNVDIVPKVQLANNKFVTAFHSDGTTVTGKIKPLGQDWVIDTGAVVTWFDFSTGIYLGCNDAVGKLGVANWTWKGLIGDLLIWNIQLSDAEIASVLASPVIGPRWSF